RDDAVGIIAHRDDLAFVEHRHLAASATHAAHAPDAQRETAAGVEPDAAPVGNDVLDQRRDIVQDRVITGAHRAAQAAATSYRLCQDAVAVAPLRGDDARIAYSGGRAVAAACALAPHLHHHVKAGQRVHAGYQGAAQCGRRRHTL